MNPKQPPPQLQLQQQQSVTSLIPTLDNLLKTLESVPFQQIDPDYPFVIKQPIDLKKIKIKLAAGEYQDPWKFVEDIRLMFDKAGMHKRKTSVVYRYCSKLAEIFEENIDPVMQSLGYCCGRKYVFQPQVLCCYGKQVCMIPRDAKYWSYGNRYTYCIKCFSKIPGDTVTLGDDTTQPPTVIKKDQFVEMKNDHLEQEPFVECLDCGRKLHQICVLHFEKIWPEGFTCENCLKAKGEKRKENKFTSKRLRQSKLGQYIENRVNGFLKKKECGAGEVTIRVVSNSEKFVEVKPGMKLRYLGTGELPDKFPYKAKKIFAFQEIDGVDICFFGMHVQEYGSECPMPNTRRVYIAYLDSIPYFEPKEYRTSVYHNIILGYLEYAKELGYNMAHIWACPPREYEDYIFHCHPTDQKIPTPKRLQEWYKKMLDKGLMDRVVMDYKNQAMEDNLKRACEIPYFEGDVWPNIIEECIKDLDQKEEKSKKGKTSPTAASNANEEDDSMDEIVKDKKRRKKRNYGKNCRRSTTGEILLHQLYTKMKKHQVAFFIIRLHSEQAAARLPPVVDKDPVVFCDIMDREKFLNLSKAKCYEFSSVRRTKFSTMALLYELHIQGQERFICNNCQIHVERRYHCITCDDFDLCVNCFDKDGQISPGNSSSSNHPSPGAQPNSSPHPPEPDIGIKPSSTGPPVDALQAVQHVQAAASRQTAPHMITPSVNYGKDVAVVSPPAENESVMTKIQQMPQPRENAQLQTNCFDKDGHNHKMKKLIFGLNDDSGTYDQKQTNPQESRLLSIQRCIKYLVHACQCRDTNCRLPSCQKMKRVVQHAKRCKQKISGGCPNCKQLIALCCHHAKQCQEANCPTFCCVIIKTILHNEQLQQKLQETQILKGNIATIQNHGMSGTVLQTTAGNSSSSNQPSPGAQPNSSPHPPEPDIVIKPSSTGPPVDALQAVQHVQAAASRQTAPHMITPSVNYGKDVAVVSPPAENESVMTKIQQMPHPRENAQLQTNCFDKDGHNHKMKKLVFGLNDDSGTCDQKQTNPQESRLLSIQRCIKYLVHACQCRDTSCRLPSCQTMKRVVQHTKSCKQKISGGCPNCKQLIALCCYHAKQCQEANCPTFCCVIIKTKLHNEQLQQKLQEAQISKGNIATIQNHGMSGTVLQTTAGSSHSSMQPSSGTQPNSSPHPPKPGIGGKPSSTGPPVVALQAVQQVQAAAARQTAPHMITPSVNYGKGNLVVSPPAANASVMTTTQEMQAQMQKPMPQMNQNAQPQTNPQIGLRQASQMMGGPNNMTNSIENSTMGPPLQAMPNPGFSSVGVQRLKLAWQRLHQALRSLPPAQRKEQALDILKSNPQLMAAFKKQRTAKQQQ